MRLAIIDAKDAILGTADIGSVPWMINDVGFFNSKVVRVPITQPGTPDAFAFINSKCDLLDIAGRLNESTRRVPLVEGDEVRFERDALNLSLADYWAEYWTVRAARTELR